MSDLLSLKRGLFVFWQYGSRWEHGSHGSTWSQKGNRATNVSGGGAALHPLPADIQRSPQICTLQLHSTVWGSASCQVDHILHGGEVNKKRLMIVKEWAGSQTQCSFRHSRELWPMQLLKSIVNPRLTHLYV